MYKTYVKRALDLTLASAGLLVLSPLLMVLVLILYAVNRGSPFFFQSRPGKNEKVFQIIKFKTMTDARGNDGDLLPDSERFTTVGRRLRKSSLDELPQLLNVIRGDMSLIGPRPLRLRYLPYYTEREKLRHDVRPGITGLAQVSGRNSIGWDKKLELDVRYVETLSLPNDIRILFQTLEKVLRGGDTELEIGMDSFDEYRSATRM